MPRLTVVDGGGQPRSADVPEGQRLVLAIESLGTRIGHRCGGWARCTTCRVEFAAGEPDRMTAAEYARLTERDLFGRYRLSCQIVADHDMAVRPAMTVEDQGWSDAGPQPEPTVTPEPTTYSKDTLAAGAGRPPEAG